MKIYGIRIKDAENDIISVGLNDLLKIIQNGELFNWSVLWLEASGDLGDDKSIVALEQYIDKSANGLYISWKDLNLLANQFYQIIDLCIIGCKNKSLLKRYEDSEKMYEACDFVIEMIDGSFWEIHSKNLIYIDKLKQIFKNIEIL